MQVMFTLLCCLFSVFAVAQNDSSETTLPIEEVVQETKTLKKIEVTGSYIKRVDEEAPNPVQTITSETLQKSGYNSVADVFRDNAITSGGVREDSGNGNPGAATTGIGPFGDNSILILLDGNRVPKMGGDNSVDLNLIPMAAIERVEILKDGASALYGSDAIGGVINFITKKNYDGGGVSLGQSLSQAGGADRFDAGVTFGKQFKKGSFNAVMQFRNNGELRDADRDYTKVSNLFVQGSSTADHPTWVDANGQSQSPDCPAGQTLNDAQGTKCYFDYSQYSWNMPKLNQYSTLLSGNYKLSENLKLRSQAVLSYRETFTRFAPAPGRFRLTEQQAVNLGIPNVPAGGMNVKYRIVEGGGTRDQQDETLSYNVSQSIEGKIAGSWTWDVTGTTGKNDARQEGQGYADIRVLQSLIDQGIFIPTAAPGNRGDISSAMFTPFQEISSTQDEIRAVATGQLSDSVSLAIGTAAGWQSYDERADEVTISGNSLGGNGSVGAGSRSNQAVFAEMSAFPTESLELSLAGRYDSYSDFGQTFNPKLSASWQATDKFMFRSSVGTGFRAPNLSNLYGGASVGFPSFIDTPGCVASGAGSPNCLTTQYEVATFANPNLKEENSVFYNFGFVGQPKKNWSIESNFFIADITNSVGPLGGTDLMRAANVFGEAYLRDNYNIDIQRDLSGAIEVINMPSAFNLAAISYRGIDFRVTNQTNVKLVGKSFSLVNDFTHIQFLNTEREPFPGAGTVRNFDNYFKSNIGTTLIRNDHSLRVATRTISGGDKNANIGGLPGDVGYGSLRTHTEFDLNYAVNNLVKKRLALNVGVKNLFDAARPLDETSQQALATSIYDPIGRYFYTRVDYTF
jgi:iron complex outermembrane recepter protein